MVVPPRASWLVGFAVFFAVGYVLLGRVLPGNPSSQPIRFNHTLHVSNGLACDDCHAGARQAEKATLPGLETCLGCHQEALGSSPEEAKIRGFGRAGREIPWVQLTRVPSHVYFSHRRHVTLGGLACADCHGPMENRTEPPRRPFRAMTMAACQGCHEQRKVSNDCNACHR